MSCEYPSRRAIKVGSVVVRYHWRTFGRHQVTMSSRAACCFASARSLGMTGERAHVPRDDEGVGPRLAWDGGASRYQASCQGLLWQYQVQVAELVPEVAAVERRAIRLLQVAAAGDRLQHRQVRRLWLVEASQQPV